jgi:hypothetical protein
VSNLPGSDAGVHFGKIGSELPDWREDEELVNEEDPDDEDIETPEDVIAILGFDPDELDDDDDEPGTDDGDPDEPDKKSALEVRVTEMLFGNRAKKSFGLTTADVPIPEDVPAESAERQSLKSLQERLRQIDDKFRGQTERCDNPEACAKVVEILDEIREAMKAGEAANPS